MLKIKPWTGDPIKENGIYSGVPMEIYHSRDCCVGESISSSGLRKIASQSPAHYWVNSVYNDERLEDGPETAALKFGRALHDLLFSEDVWKEKYITRPETRGDGMPFNGRSASDKIWLDNRKKEGKTVLTIDERERLVGVGKALQKHPYVDIKDKHGKRKGALDGQIELSIFWKDKETNIWLKSRPDVMPRSDLVFVDLKKTRSIMLPLISHTIAEYGYHQQGALVAEGCENVLGHKIEAFHLLFVEDELPYSTVMVRLKDEDLIAGMHANRLALRKFAHGIKTGEWPGPYDERQASGDVYVDLPDWLRKDIDWRWKADGAR